MKLENNYRIDKLFNERVRLWIKDQLTKESINAIATKKFSFIKIDDGDWRDLDILLEYKSKITNLIINTKNLDWNIISKFVDLEELDVRPSFKCNIEFEKLEKLRKLTISWNNGYEKLVTNLNNLVSLAISNLNCSSLETFGNMQNLKSFGIIHSRKISSLKNIGNFKKLEYIWLQGCGKLNDYSELALLPNLKVLRLDNCKKEYDYSVLGQLQNIDKIIIGGAMKDFQWVKKLKTLRILRFNCTIEEGDLGFLYDMPNLELIYFNDRHNFSIKAKDMHNHLTEKGYDQEALKNEIYIPPTR